MQQRAVLKAPALHLQVTRRIRGGQLPLGRDLAPLQGSLVQAKIGGAMLATRTDLLDTPC